MRVKKVNDLLKNKKTEEHKNSLFSGASVFRFFSFSISLFLCFSVFLFIFGCEAFVRKFTRKPKKEKIPQEQMVLSPVEYGALETGNKELYSRNFLYWKSWHDELLTALSDNLNHKKQIECVVEAVKSLEQLKVMLKKDNQEKLSGYIESLNNIKSLIDEDPYNLNARYISLTVERVKRGIMQNFSYKKIKDSLI